ncbi:transglutaminase family protein [Paenibacillus sp. GCM10023248]|uniref:transglutaminase-like domain-containing protein n=1 Tax=Bacillales TaxID=1385 RepID=UPI0023788DE7|nr:MULTISPECIES: transglutaminase family protein [Bacillales]MDD9271765.1 transglutaminase family protein [Paenibacillus sp. MAHUQ-63]MDR6884651.1 transglutaminase-like putative cysteine protease [Bacillus sp. 3255]
MNLICESLVINDYLIVTEEVDYDHQLIAELTSKLEASSQDQVDFIKKSYEYVRDEIDHSWDIQSSRITCSASETLIHEEGICYAKANLLCAILRRAGIPAGFCYQRLTLGDTPDTGYCIHALNAVYVQKLEKWIRLDPRGNKPGIHAEFSLDEEKLAFPIREDYDEADYLTIYKSPNAKTIGVLRSSTDCINMYLHGLPDHL